MSSISSVNGSGSGFSMMISGMKRPDPSKMVDNLFSKLDTTNKGYLEKSDLQSALSQLPGSGSTSGTGSTSNSTNVDEMFKKLDSNSDDKITKNEMSSGIKKLADALDSQFNQMRMNGTSQGGSGDSTTKSGMSRPDPSKMVDDLFSKLDTTNKGYLEKSDLQSALSQSPGSGSSSGTGSSSTTNVDEMFKKLDNNGDGKLTKSEMTSGMSSTAQAGKGGGTPPPGGRPAPPSGAGGANSASGASSTSSTQSSSTTKTYDSADTNQDGKVSAQEKLAYELKAQNSASTSSTSSDSSATSSTSTDSDARVMKQIMNLVHAYSSFDSSTNNSGLSVTA